MGQYAEDIIDRVCDSSGDYMYKYNQKNHKIPFIKDTPSETKIRKVRKELAILIKQKQKEYFNFNSNVIVNSCRRYINLKYGKSWRERGLCVNNENQWKELSFYKDPEFDWNYELTKHLNK